MEWLRCNRCYREMKNSKRAFSLTQCGHLYCNKCVPEGFSKCPECGTANVTALDLAYPPKLETTHNYFGELDDFMEICYKTATFQYNQLAIAVRGFDQISKKYENMKKMYWNTTEQTKKLTKAYMELKEETNKLEKCRESLLKMREAQKSKTPSKFDCSRQIQEIQYTSGHSLMASEPTEPRASGSAAWYEREPTFMEVATSDTFEPEDRKLQTPQLVFNPRTCFSTGTRNSDSYASDSSHSSIFGTATNPNNVFRVPNVQKVPRSAASLKRKSQNFVTLSAHRSGGFSS